MSLAQSCQARLVFREKKSGQEEEEELPGLLINLKAGSQLRLVASPCPV